MLELYTLIRDVLCAFERLAVVFPIKRLVSGFHGNRMNASLLK